MSLIAVSSGKGGTGKSCVTAYTGMALAASGKKTLLLEMGATAGSLDLVLGVQDAAVFHLIDILEDRCDVEAAILSVPQNENLFILPAGPRPLQPVHAPSFIKLLGSLRMEYDFVLVDGVDFDLLPPGRADLVLLVLTPDSLSVRAAAQHAHMLRLDGANMRLIINNVPPRIIPVFGADDFDDIIDRTGVQLIGVIPASPKLHYSANNAQPLHSESLTVQVFHHIAGRLCGRSHPLLIR